MTIKNIALRVRLAVKLTGKNWKWKPMSREGQTRDVVCVWPEDKQKHDGRRRTSGPWDWAMSTQALSCHSSSPASVAASSDLSPYSLASAAWFISKWQRPISWYSHVFSSADLLVGSFSSQLPQKTTVNSQLTHFAQNSKMGAVT